MHSVRRIVGFMAVGLVAISVSTASFAQQGGGRRGGQRISVAQIPVSYLTPLNLTDDQKTKIGDIETKLGADIKAAQPADASQLDPQARRDLRTKTRQLTQTADDSINALLTDDQKTALKGVVKDVQALGSAGIPAAALVDLKLTDDQKTQLIKIGTDSETAIQDKIKAANGDNTQLRQIFTDARRDARDKTNAILTEDQKNVLKKYPQGFGGRRPAPPAPAAAQ